MQWERKVTIVTGGASGIGAACCRNFAARGAKVVVADLNGDGAKAVAAEFGGLGVGCNVGNEDEVNALVKAAEDHYGPVDIFFNNAGINSGREILNTPLSVWDDHWQVNVMAHVYAVRAVLPGMLERGSGYLIHTASMDASGVISPYAGAIVMDAASRACEAKEEEQMRIATKLTEDAVVERVKFEQRIREAEERAAERERNLIK